MTIASAQVVTTLIPDLGTLEPGDTVEIQQPGVDGLVQLTPDIDYLEPGQQYAVFLNRAHLAGDVAEDCVVVGITTGIFSADAELAEGDSLAGVTFTHDGPHDGDSLPRSFTIEDLQD